MRRRAAIKRVIIPDAKYGSVLVAKFINYIMLDGKKAIIEKHVYSAFDQVQDKLKRDGVEVFNEVIERITPSIEVKSRRVGGATYQVPVEVSERRGTALALQWLVKSIRKQTGKTLGEKIFKSLNEVLNNTGWACKKKEEVLKMAEANKAFSSYSW